MGFKERFHVSKLLYQTLQSFWRIIHDGNTCSFYNYCDGFYIWVYCCDPPLACVFLKTCVLSIKGPLKGQNNFTEMTSLTCTLIVSTFLDHKNKNDFCVQWTFNPFILARLGAHHLCPHGSITWSPVGRWHATIWLELAHMSIIRCVGLCLRSLHKE